MLRKQSRDRRRQRRRSQLTTRQRRNSASRGVADRPHYTAAESEPPVDSIPGPTRRVVTVVANAVAATPNAAFLFHPLGVAAASVVYTVTRIRQRRRLRNASSSRSRSHQPQPSRSTTRSAIVATAGTPERESDADRKARYRRGSTYDGRYDELSDALALRGESDSISVSNSTDA